MRRAPSSRVVVTSVLMGLAVVVLPSCSSSSQAARKSSTVNVTMEEYRFAYYTPVPSGRVVFRVRNAGQLQHELLLVSVPPGFSGSIGEQVQSTTPMVFPTKARVPQRDPQAIGEFAVDLLSGRYAFLCFIRDADGVNHARKGMFAEFDVR